MVGGDNTFKVAIFGANVSTGQGGLNFAENTIKLGNWGEVQDLAQKADRYGVDGFIPIARWQGLAGPDRPWGRQFETFTWAAGLAAVTQNIQIIATCNVQFIHPVMGAKMVSHHRPHQRRPHGPERHSGLLQARVPTSSAWNSPSTTSATSSPTSGLRSPSACGPTRSDYEFDFDGKFFNLKGAQAYPKPVQSPRPMVMSAGSSPAGQEFAFKHANVLFAAIASVEHSGESRRNSGRTPTRPAARTSACGPARTSSARTPRRKPRTTPTTSRRTATGRAPLRYKRDHRSGDPELQLG